ncbi:hypothetical protein EDD16DRAFT_1526153 [Pisolithus croceorrhizus]|nr:hypothetical protein EDD16DRAFT_1526153 [Pisolithus croceorrhizus]KAI6102535.1 hypothetical protein EV401DRAFT_1893874 [Pisolithus croceorrhizus]
MSVADTTALKKSVGRILHIYEQRVISTDHLTRAERLQSWREVVKSITDELDSVRPIIDNVDKILHMLIGINKFICWSERLGSPQHPFPRWNEAIFPSKDSIAGSATSEHVITPSSNAKGREGDESPIAVDHPTIPALDNNMESEVEDMDELIDDEDKVVCTRSADSGVCDPCKKRRIGCTKATHRAKSTTCRSKPTIPATTPARHNPSRVRRTPCKLDELPETKAEDVDDPPTKKKCVKSTAVDNALRPSASSTRQNKNQPFSIIIPAPKRASSYVIPPSCRTEASGSTLVRAVPAESQTAMPASAPTPEWLPPSSTPGIPELLTWVDAMTDRQDLILAWVNDLERWILGLDSRTPAPTPRLADDQIRMLKTELAEFQWTVGTLTQEVEALRLKVQGATGADVDGSMSQHIANQTEQVSSLHQDSMPPDNSATASMESAAQQLQGPMIDPAEKEPEAMAATEPLVVEDAAHTCEVLVTAATPPNEMLEVALTTNMEVYTSTTEEGGHSEVGNGNVALERGTDEAMVPADDRLQVNSGTSTNLDMAVDGP